MGKKVARKRDRVELTAYDSAGEIVERAVLTLEEYYDGLHELLDKNSYRARRGIVVMEGRIYDPAGKLDQEFRNTYSSSGAYVGGQSVHSDGTVTQD